MLEGKEKVHFMIRHRRRLDRSTKDPEKRENRVLAKPIFSWTVMINSSQDMIVNEISLVIQNIISEIQMIKRESTGK